MLKPDLSLNGAATSIFYVTFGRARRRDLVHVWVTKHTIY